MLATTISQVQGDSAYLEFTVGAELAGETPDSIAGWRFWFTVKSDPSASDAEADIQKSTDNGGIVIIDAIARKGLISIAPLDTERLTPRRYSYDLQAITPGGDVYTLQRGSYFIEAQITRASS